MPEESYHFTIPRRMTSFLQRESGPRISWVDNSLPLIDSDMYIIQAETDQVVLEGHDCFP